MSDGAAANIDTLRTRLVGPVLTPDNAGYDAARSVFNAAITSLPCAIASCRGVDDVRVALAWARENQCPLSVRAGGHGVHGLAVRDGGLVIDLRAMSDVVVDIETRRARVGGGTIWQAVYDAAAPHKLAPVGGTDTRPGVVGFTIGSGNAWLMRRNGLACDNVVSFELVTADGAVIEVDESEADLYWALKGGGGNFGVVTAATLQLHPVPGRMWAGTVFYAGEDAAQTLAGYRDAVDVSSRDTAVMWAYAAMPDISEIPEPLRGRSIVVMPMLHVGTLDEGAAALAPFRQLASPLLDSVAEVPFAEGIGVANGFAPEGMLNHWRGAYLRTLDDETIAQALPVATAVPEMGLQVWRMGGAVDDVALESTAIPRAGRRYYLGIVSAWVDPEASARVIAGTDAAADAFAPWVSGACPNHTAQLSQAELRAALGDPIFDRLREVKRRYDPDNVFDANQNIEP